MNVYQPNDKLGRDVVISEGYPTRNFSKINKLHLLSLTLQDSIDNDSRFLFKIGFSSIPQESKIDSAFIYLSAIKPGHFGENNSFVVQRITNVWVSDEVSWETQPTTDEASGIVMDAPNDKMKSYKIDVTGFVNDVVQEKYRNFGFLVKLLNEDKPHKGIRFASSEFKEAGKRPKLEIYYQ